LLNEFIIYLFSYAVYFGPPTALLLAFPLRAVAFRLLGRNLGFWKAALAVYLIDIAGHMAVLAIRYPLGAYRPPVTPYALHWIENFISLAAVAFIAALVLPRSSQGGSRRLGGVAAFSIITALLLLLVDAALYVIMSTILRPHMPH
jgi:hypothetical protein